MKNEVSYRYALLGVSMMVAACGGSDGVRANVEPQPMPMHGSFTGVWFSPQYGRMDMMQQGRSVVGQYSKDERTGKIQGSAKGNLMRFRWEEVREMIPGRPTTTRGRGYFRYIADRDGDHKIVGEWGHDQDEVGGGPWNGVKSRKLKPEIQFSGTAGASTAAGSSRGAGSDQDGPPSNLRNVDESAPENPPSDPTRSTDPAGASDDLGPL